jgi:hypothetical protein
MWSCCSAGTGRLTLAAGRRAPRLGSRGLARSAERRAPPRSATPRPAAGRPQPGPKSEPADSVVPYPLRVLTVGTAIGMATPFYCIVAVPVAAWRLRMVKPELAMLLGVTASAVLLLCKDYIAPWLLANGNTILPLSLANGLAGGLTYVAQPAELATGRPRARVANLPPFDLLSSLITYLTAPHILATARYPCTRPHLSYAAADGALGTAALAASRFAGPGIGLGTALLAPYLLPVTVDACGGMGAIEVGAPAHAVPPAAPAHAVPPARAWSCARGAVCVRSRAHGAGSHFKRRLCTHGTAIEPTESAPDRERT